MNRAGLSAGGAETERIGSAEAAITSSGNPLTSSSRRPVATNMVVTTSLQLGSAARAWMIQHTKPHVWSEP
jgi:hypothetical protein